MVQHNSQNNTKKWRARPLALPTSVFAESIKLCILFKARKVAHIYPSMLERKKQNYECWTMMMVPYFLLHCSFAQKLTVEEENVDYLP